MAGAPVFDVEFRGFDKFQRALKQRKQDVIQATAAALYMEAEELMTAAKRLTPVDTGALRKSAHARLPVIDKDKVEVEAGFGGPAGSGNTGGETNSEDVGYAVRVHENLEARHIVGQAKYLEKPFDERKATFGERFTQRVLRRLK